MAEGKKFNNCVVVFDQNDFGTYFTGQIMSGKVIITLEKAKKLKGIKLQILGYAACQWREKYGQKLAIQKIKAKDNHIYYGREDYIASTSFLIGSEQNSNFNMNAGTYTYTFSCPIPPNCPSSFEGSYGQIRYLTKVTFMRNGASDRVHNVGFTVLKLLDLNTESKLLRSPASNDAIENVCFFLSKAVRVKVVLQQTGYVPGQFILVSTDVDNQSALDCKNLIISLNLCATYSSDMPSLHTVSEKICLTKKVCGHVPRNSRRSFAETLLVPATAPTCEHISRVVRVSYELCVMAAMNSVMRNPRASIPITIGNVPLTMGSMIDEDRFEDEEEELEEMPTTSARANDTVEETSDDASEIELPPPSYEEAVFMSTNIADNDANTVSEDAPFTPRYPVFNVDENTLAFSSMGLSPPPNLPQKRRRRRRRNCATPVECGKERAPTESPIQI